MGYFTVGFLQIFKKFQCGNGAETAVLIRGSPWAGCYGKILSKISNVILNPSEFLLKKIIYQQFLQTQKQSVK